MTADAGQVEDGRVRIVAAGDAALIVELDERIDPDVNAHAVALAKTIQAAGIDGLRDVVPTYRTVAVHFDPTKTNRQALFRQLEQEAAALSPSIRHDGTAHAIPVQYGDAAGPDLAQVAAAAGLSSEEVIARHTAITYRVFMLGFLPGFAYLGSLDPRIGMPRRATPRTRVPAGSVAIAGGQTGIYPIDSPGGWNIIGWTDVRPFDASREHPFLFKPGDTVKFVAV